MEAVIPTASPAEDCCVKVAVHIRPLIGYERAQGCKDCVRVVPEKSEVQICSHSFSFDHVYGSTGSPSSDMFEECITPLLSGLFQGYNATVLAYGQTGSGKTYTMGTGLKNGSQTGIIHNVMNVLFNKIESLRHQVEYQLHVSFIEILKEEVKDLLDQISFNKSDIHNGRSGKESVPGKPPIQIRETSNGVITLAGSTEVSVGTLKEMVTCLEHGSLSRATGSTNMNSQSSRSHAIFTITLEKLHKINQILPTGNDHEEYLCAKLHLVDLAGSERAKRTGCDGLRFKEGVHINKGLLALGNVISALGDEKKRKQNIHVPYRDSKLTRLLQDSLGGNSRTVMIGDFCGFVLFVLIRFVPCEIILILFIAACGVFISVACISPADINVEESINTLKYANRARNIQNKLVVNRDPSSSEMLRMRQQLEYLQAELCAHSTGYSLDEVLLLKERIAWLEAANDDLRRELQEYRGKSIATDLCEIDAHDGSMCSVESDDCRRSLHSVELSNYQMDEVLSEKEWEEHTKIRDSLNKKLHELNRQLEEKEILALKRKQECQVQLLRQKQKSDEAAKRLKEEIQSIKAQKVQLQQRIRLESEQFRQWKASHEKDLLQLRKKGRRNEYERHKLQALNHRQKLVLQRKTEEAAVATKRLKELLKTSKFSLSDNSTITNGQGANGHGNEKFLQRWLDHELEVIVKVHEVRYEYEKQSQLQAVLGEELVSLKQAEEVLSKGPSHPTENELSSAFSMLPDARMSRISLLENMINISSSLLVAMASQLSEAGDRDCGHVKLGRWLQLCSMGEAKSLLQYSFSSLADARCRLWEKEAEIKELKEKFKEVVCLLQKWETQRKEVEEFDLRGQAVMVGFTTLPQVQQLKYSQGTANCQFRDSTTSTDPRRKMGPLRQLSTHKIATVMHDGKLWRWKRSHHQWFLEWKFKWQKPWRLSEFIRQNEEKLFREKSRSLTLSHPI